MPGTVRTAVGRDIWSKILGKISMKKLVNKSGCFIDWVMCNRKPMQNLKHRCYICVFIGISYDSSCTILDTPQFTKIELTYTPEQ